MPLSEIAFKLYAFVYNYSSVKPQEGDLLVRSWGPHCWPILLTNIPKCPEGNTLLRFYINCIIGYMSVKLAHKPLNTVEIANSKIH